MYQGWILFASEAVKSQLVKECGITILQQLNAITLDFAITISSEGLRKLDPHWQQDAIWGLKKVRTAV